MNRRLFVTAATTRAAAAVLLAARAKIVAVLLGPEGVGLLGLLSAAQEIGAQAADAGLSHSGTRATARARGAGDGASLARLRRAWRSGALAAAGLGGLALLALAEPLARALTEDTTSAWAFAVIAPGLALTVLSRWRYGLVSAHDRATALSRATVISCVLTLALTVMLVVALGRDGLAPAVVALPLCTLIALAPIRLPHAPRAPGALRELAPLWRAGIGLMAIAQMSLIAPMAIRVWLTREVDLAAAGLFQAAWTIWAQAMAVALHVIAIDFFPRISALAAEPVRARAALTEQLATLLGFGAPAMVAGIALAEPAIVALFDTPFRPAAPLLQALLLGGILRMVVAPVECLLTAKGHARDVFLGGAAALLSVLTGSWLAWPHLGLTGIGIAYAVAQAMQLTFLAIALRRRTGERRLPAAPATLIPALVAAGIAFAGPIVGLAAAAALLALARPVPARMAIRRG